MTATPPAFPASVTLRPMAPDQPPAPGANGPASGSNGRAPAGRTPARGSRSGLFAHPGRVAVVAVVLLACANLGFVVLHSASSDSTAPTLPVEIESVTPQPGDVTRPLDTIGVDLQDDLTGVLVLDRIEIPEDQLERVVSLGQVTFRPGPGKDLKKLDPGDHTVTVLYWPQGKDRPAHPSSYTWTFRSGA